MSGKNSNNVIQFPGRKKEDEAVQPQPSPQPQPVKKAGRTAVKVSKKNLAGTVIAIILATAAVNSQVFDPSAQTFATTSSSGRGIASTEPLNWTRDAEWEKAMAEQLASPSIRAIASTHIGRPASMEERLRWGILEEKYTIAYNVDDQRIHAILLQDESAAPAYILNRDEFLREYGTLFDSDFAGAKLKSVESSDGKTVESYTLFRKGNQPGAEARFELDRHKRLISLKVQPLQI